MSVEEIVQRILLHRQDLTREEVIRAIEMKKAASGGFLTDDAAARLVAAELGVEIKLKETLPKIHIRQLVSGLNDVTVSGRVLNVNKPYLFQRSDGEGQVARLLIADKTGCIQVVLWDDKAEVARKIQLGQIVKVLHGYVRKSRGGEMELHVGQRGDIQIAPGDVEENNFPSIKEFLEKIANISEAHKRVSVEGRIQTVYPVSTFQRRDGTQGKVMRLLLKDETGQISVVFWNEKTEDLINAKEGATVLLMGVKVRKNRDGRVELHVEKSANVELLNHHESLPYVKDLKEGMQIALIEGIVSTKPTLKEVTTRKGEKVSVTSFELKDSTGRVQVSAWRGHAEKAKALAVGAKIRLKNVYVRRGFGDQLEITTRASTEIEVEQ
jgi:replication factor A1